MFKLVWLSFREKVQMLMDFDTNLLRVLCYYIYELKSNEQKNFKIDSFYCF